MPTWAGLLGMLLCVSSPAAASQRWLLAIGENKGLLGEEPLHYAEEDARRVAQAFQELADVPAANTILVRGANAERLRGAMVELETRMRAAASPADRLIVYVSAHAGDAALHLRNTELPLSELVELLKRAPARVGLLLVDACRSGAITGTKGLRPSARAPWTSDVAPLEGRVLITASGADEYAQESDALGGSYFTHHFVAGMRGAADASGDGRVTLDEAYRWAWGRTVESTFSTKGGVQTPRFKWELRGQGELVLTDLRAAKTQLTLDVDAPGTWLLVDAASSNVVAHLEKPKGPMSFALPPGTYRVRLRNAAGYLEKWVSLEDGQRLVLREQDLDSAALIRVAVKGRDAPLYIFSASGSYASAVVGALAGMPGIDLRLRFERDWFGIVNQLAVGLVVRTANSGLVDIDFVHTEVELKGGLGHHWDFSRVTLSAGGDLGALLVQQSRLPDGSSRTGLGLTLGGTAEARLHLLGAVDLSVSAQGGLVVLQKSVGITASPRVSGTVGLAFMF